MPSLRLLSSDNTLKIFNRQQSSDDDVFQVIYVLLMTWSPFEEKKHSLQELIGSGAAGDDVIQDITVRMNNVAEMMIKYYNVQELNVLDIYDEDGSGQAYSIDLFLLYTDGSYEQGTVTAEAA